MKTPLLACMLLAVMESSLFASAGFFGGSGHTIELSQSDQIQMVSEEVTITPLPGFTSELDEVEYRCRFVLKNLSPTATTIQVGLPLDGESGEHSLDEDESSASDVDETDRVMSYRFIARDDDNTYHVRYLRQDRHAKFRRLFMWDMAFAPQEEKNLRVGYVLPHYKPDAPIRFVWYGTSLPRDASQCDCIVRQLMGPLPVEAEVLELAEIVAAFYGIPPKSDSVKEFVQGQVWYHPKSGLERSALTDEQRETLARLEMIAKGGFNAVEAGQDSTSLKLSLVGPFVPDAKLNSDPVSAPWLKIARIRFRSSSGYERLDIEYHAATAEVNSSRRIHYFIAVTDDEGRVHILADETRRAPGPRTDIVAGSLVGLDDSFPLPVPLSSIRKLDMRFTPEGTQ